MEEALIRAALDYQNNALLVNTGITLFVFLLVFGLFEKAFTPSKSKKARELVSDLYVIGMVKKFASADEIDIEGEMKNMRKLEKLEKMKYKSLDKSIEDNLKEKLAAEHEKKIEQIK